MNQPTHSEVVVTQTASPTTAPTVEVTASYVPVTDEKLVAELSKVMDNVLKLKFTDSKIDPKTVFTEQKLGSIEANGGFYIKDQAPYKIKPSTTIITKNGDVYTVAVRINDKTGMEYGIQIEVKSVDGKFLVSEEGVDP